VLGASSRPQLISATLRTLKAFLSWIPLGYLFETDLIRTLIERFFAAAQFRNAALECLTEIASLADLEPKYDAKVVQLYVGVLQALGQVVPPNASLASAFEATGREADQTFVRRLALFFSGFFKAHLRLVETREQGPLLLDGLNYLVRISAVPDNEVFQICLDFWHASVCGVTLRHLHESSPSSDEVGGIFFEFGSLEDVGAVAARQRERGRVDGVVGAFPRRRRRSESHDAVAARPCPHAGSPRTCTPRRRVDKPPAQEATATTIRSSHLLLQRAPVVWPRDSEAGPRRAGRRPIPASSSSSTAGCLVKRDSS
jgi:hypothetical protein